MKVNIYQMSEQEQVTGVNDNEYKPYKIWNMILLCDPVLFFCPTIFMALALTAFQIMIIL